MAVKNKTGLVATIVALAVTLLVVIGFTVWDRHNTSSDSSTIETTQTEQVPGETDMPPAEPDPEPAIPPTDIDTSNAAWFAIEPLEIEMMHDNTLAFEYHILRTPEGTQYIEFSTEKLIGTRCTDDKGVFASFIKNPSTDEDKTTVTETTEVNGDTYGLSLAGDSCASDAALLDKYQKGLADFFSLLRPWQND